MALQQLARNGLETRRRVTCPFSQGNIIEGVLLNRVCILRFFCPKQGQGFKSSAAKLCSNIGRVLLPHPFPSSVSCHLYNIRRRIRKYLTGETTQSLVYAIVMGRTAYCNSLLFNTPAKHIAKIQRLQSCAARLICRIFVKLLNLTT